MLRVMNLPSIHVPEKPIVKPLNIKSIDLIDLKFLAYSLKRSENSEICENNLDSPSQNTVYTDMAVAEELKRTGAISYICSSNIWQAFYVKKSKPNSRSLQPVAHAHRKPRNPQRSKGDARLVPTCRLLQTQGSQS